MTGLIGTKLGMTRLVEEETGKILPVTLIEVADHTVTQVKTDENDGYCAMQVSTVPLKKPSKTRSHKYVEEFASSDLAVGDTYSLDVLSDVSEVAICAISKGKGFAGRIKRFNQSRGPMSHGSKNHRQMGSTGVMKPNRTIKGWRMPGHMGHVQVTIHKVNVVKVDAYSGIVAVQGSVPGPNGGRVSITL